ncbi:hypothetical protein Psch_03221 [Pelotomaculum schinkii]|uniref:Uncharacterized protein n=1 Tax=Pelotomaculum schinkii TaxID=78350 RepID=A0A4Y7RCX8_9FIRM|nr:hypothetical protein Psch_03221 [Pelotomaculum schinkii]
MNMFYEIMNNCYKTGILIIRLNYAEGMNLLLPDLEIVADIHLGVKVMEISHKSMENTLYR